MKSYVITIFIVIVTQFCAHASEESDLSDEDNLVTTYQSLQRSLDNFKENLTPRLSHDDEIRTGDEYAKNKGLVRFENGHTQPTSKANFFPIEPDNSGIGEINNDEIANLKKDLREKPYNDEQSPDNDRDITDEENRFETFENIKNKQIRDTTKEPSDAYKSNTSGRVVFEDDIKTENLEPIRNRKRKPRRKQRIYPVENKAPISTNALYNSFNYPGYPYPGYAAQYPASYTSDKRPSYLLNQPGYETSYQGYGLYPGYPIKKQAQNGQTTQVNTKYPHQYEPAEAQGSSGTRVNSNLQHSGYPENGRYGYAANPNSPHGQYIPYPGNQGYPVSSEIEVAALLAEIQAPSPVQQQMLIPNTNWIQRRPKSLTQQAVSAVAEALTSIALFDDKQCVPRLLCEVASGRAAGSPTLLKATAGLGPLLSILQSYNSASSSPLFLFGRAAVLGMTSTGNTITCHRAYPQCPRDPAELINYLNNHNGGFFRFFGKPQRPQTQQNLDHFYNHLAGQIGNQQQGQEQAQQQNYANTYGYGAHNQYPKSNEINKHRRQDKIINLNEKDVQVFHDIEERIQNKPNIDLLDDESTGEGSKWTFPDEIDNTKKERKPRRPRKNKLTTDATEYVRLDRGGRPLKFPDERGHTDDTERDKRRDFIRTQKVKFFPNENDLIFGTNAAANEINLQEYVFDYKHNFYVKRPKPITNTGSNDKSQLVYIVRGNGDPNYPEIVRLKPGQRS